MRPGPLAARLDGVQRGGGDGVDAAHIPVQVLPNEHHVKVAQVEAHALQIDQVDLCTWTERGSSWRQIPPNDCQQQLANYPRLQRRPAPPASASCGLSPPSVMTVKGISVSSTRQLTVGIMKELVRWGTPWKPSSRKGTSNSRLRSLQAAKGCSVEQGCMRNKCKADQQAVQHYSSHCCRQAL